jgi:diguanylate cyclase (GGDEF)-like protein
MALKDPRLIEIELLSNFERDTFTRMYGEYNRPNPMNGDERLVDDALFHLILDGAVIRADGNRAPSGASVYGGTPNPRRWLDSAIENTVAFFLSQQIIRVQVTQLGRLRLFRLRDEILNKDRLRDDSGILWAKRHWESDRDARLLIHDFETPFSMLMLDVDKLKDLNTHFLHSGADTILRGIFEILRASVPSDTSYRLGGDEAGALLADVTIEQAEAIAEKVRATVEEDFSSRKMPDGRTPTVSIGVGSVRKRISGLAFEQAVEELRARAKSTRNKIVSSVLEP